MAQKCKQTERQLDFQTKWNVATCIRRGSNTSFFSAFHFSPIELLPHLQARACEGGNKGSNLMREKITLFQKLWPLLYKRAKLNSRSTNKIISIFLGRTSSLGQSLKTDFTHTQLYYLLTKTNFFYLHVYSSAENFTWGKRLILTILCRETAIFRFPPPTAG